MHFRELMHIQAHFHFIPKFYFIGFTRERTVPLAYCDIFLFLFSHYSSHDILINLTKQNHFYGFCSKTLIFARIGLIGPVNFFFNFDKKMNFRFFDLFNCWFVSLVSFCG